MITGINHINLSVKNLEESFQFYQEVLGFQPIAKWKKGAYFLAGDLWFCIFEDENTRDAPLKEYTHIAFTVCEQDFAKISDRIRNSQAKIWQENTSEGASVYFTDPNHHKLEIHASDLATRIKTAKENPYEGMEFFV
ncbi:phosphonate metabolism protein PhnM [Scytonema sp. HK-05]|uniref:VOC family protein n=1 Tax=Scytonema sp. HK-05 TaxID=1137095 RepID=UPI000936BC01|nr:VOC family protein [Scytonema sp. HK-05]OKH57281.1 glutathione transferase [Scytonema sp. HK-05]BAY48653.1 phosphonate metabolism protein PhnM [Scytonema sp. HK-05]